MGPVKKLETQIADAMKGLPQLPDSTKEGIAKIWPWLALIGGLVQVIAAITLYRLVNYADRVYDFANSLSAYYGTTVGPTGMDKTIIYLGVLMLVVDAVILLLAFPKLQKREKGGWDLLFLGTLVNLAYGVVQIFTYNRGIGSFISSLIGTAISLYLLFQVREKFGGPKLPATTADKK